MINTRVIVNRYGGPDQLQVFEVECPEPREDEVRVEVVLPHRSMPSIALAPI
jgi:NADPH:quinone reductase-like Zn-dependent oxidoreductase